MESSGKVCVLKESIQLYVHEVNVPLLFKVVIGNLVGHYPDPDQEQERYDVKRKRSLPKIACDCQLRASLSLDLKVLTYR